MSAGAKGTHLGAGDVLVAGSRVEFEQKVLCLVVDGLVDVLLKEPLGPLGGDALHDARRWDESQVVN